MLRADDNKPMGKPGQRNRKKKSGQRTKSAPQHAAATDQLQHAEAETGPESVEEIIHEIGEKIGQELAQTSSLEMSEHVSVPAASTEATPDETPAMAVELSADHAPVSPQTIANAYADYTKRSLDQIWTFFGRLAAARSPTD